MILGPPKLPAACGSCGHRLPFERIAEQFYGVLLEAYYFQHFSEELRMLNKVADFYRRNPSSEGAIQPHAMRVLQSRDPKVRKKLFENVPVAQIKLPPAREPPLEAQHPDDQEVIEYLRHNSFNLGGRLQFVTEQVERTKGAVDQVSCPRCRAGRMRLLSDGSGDIAASR
jgi:hypothetical protein